MKFRVIVSDPPWNFGDKLSMSEVKRGALANYDTLSLKDIKDLPVKEIAADDAILVLWCPSSLLSEGLEVMNAWGFRQTQTHIWVKTKKDSLKDLGKILFKTLKDIVVDGHSTPASRTTISETINHFDINDVLAFGMGRLFRQTHELAIVGVRGKIYEHLKNKSQRSVHFFPATKHSVKPEALQDMLDKMFPDGDRLEMFARRSRTGWTCIGNECQTSFGEDIRISLDRLKQ